MPNEKILRYQEIERRGLLDQLPPEKQAMWEEIKRRGLDNAYSGMEKAKYTTRAAIEGATLGLGDIVSGGTNVLMNDLAKVTHGQTLKDRALGLAKMAVHISPLGVAAAFLDPETRENFKQGRKEFVEEQDEFKKHHGTLNTVGEVGGGLITSLFGGGAGAAAKGAQAAKAAATAGKAPGLFARAGKNALTGVKEGAKWGGLFGAGNGLTEDAERLSPEGMLLGGAQGAALGAGAGGVLGGAGSLAIDGAAHLPRLFNPARRTYNKLSKAAGGDLEKSIEQNIPLMDFADKKVNRLTQDAYISNDQAGKLLSEYGEQRMADHVVNTENIKNKMFGTKGFDTLMEEHAARNQELAQELYAKAYEKGEIKVDLDDNMRRMLYKLRNDPDANYVLRGYKDNDIFVLDKVKQGLDAKISSIERARKNPNGRVDPADAVAYPSLVASRAKLLQQMDAQNRYYRIARSVAEQGIKFEEGAQKGLRAFLDPAADIASKLSRAGRAGKRPDFNAMRQKALKLTAPGAAEKRLAHIQLVEDIYNAAANAERDGYLTGMGQYLSKQLESSNAHWDRAAQRLFSPNRLSKMKAAGIDVEKYLPEIQKEIKAARNMTETLRGSQTAERQGVGDRLYSFTRNPIKKAFVSSVNWLTRVDPEMLARMVIDPGYAALVRAQVGALPAAAYTNLGRAGSIMGRMTGPLTSREKAILRKQVQNKLMSQVRGNSVYNSALGKDIRFNRPGINKAVSSSDDLEKLKMLEYAQEIARQGKPYQASRKSGQNSYDYLMAPVEIEGQKTAAGLTLRNGYLYNINPINYVTKMHRNMVVPRTMGGRSDAFLAQRGLKPRVVGLIKNPQGLPRSQSEFNGNYLKPQVEVVPLTKQGPLEAQNPRRLSQKQSGAIAKGTNSITQKAPFVKPLSFKDYLIMLGRAQTLGAAGGMLGGQFAPQKPFSLKDYAIELGGPQSRGMVGKTVKNKEVKNARK